MTPTALGAIVAEMTVKDLLNGVIYAGVFAGAVMGILTFLHYAVVRPVRGFLRKEIVGSLVDIKDAIDQNTKLTDELSHELKEHISNGGHSHPA